jgi:hypothetical protein
MTVRSEASAAARVAGLDRRAKAEDLPNITRLLPSSPLALAAPITIRMQGQGNRHGQAVTIR